MPLAGVQADRHARRIVYLHLPTLKIMAAKRSERHEFLKAWFEEHRRATVRDERLIDHYALEFGASIQDGARFSCKLLQLDLAQLWGLGVLDRDTLSLDSKLFNGREARVWIYEYRAKGDPP